MRYQLLASVLVGLAASAGAQEAAPPAAPAAPAAAEKPICHMVVSVGSNLRKRVCKTRVEWNASSEATTPPSAALQHDLTGRPAR